MGNTLRRFNMERSALKICFFGPTGSGKSTCFEIAKDAIIDRLDPAPSVFRADVACPLHEIQWNAYMKLRIVNPPQDRFEDMRQDGALLSFLAGHFEAHLGDACYGFVDSISKACPNRGAAFVNTDCRNNAYDSLVDLGFWFVRVVADESTIHTRLVNRRDITPCGVSAVDRIDRIEPHWTVENNGTLDELREKVGCVVQNAIFKYDECSLPERSPITPDPSS